MKKIYIVLVIVLGLMISFVVITQIIYKGEYYRRIERLLLYKNCPAYVYITGEYTGTVPEVSVIESEVRSLGFKVSVKQLEDKKINVIVAGKSDDQTEAVYEKVNSALSKLGDFQIEKMEGGGASRAKTCPLD